MTVKHGVAMRHGDNITTVVVHELPLTVGRVKGKQLTWADDNIIHRGLAPIRP